MVRTWSGVSWTFPVDHVCFYQSSAHVELYIVFFIENALQVRQRNIGTMPRILLLRSVFGEGTECCGGGAVA